jgi:hypothetical protein
MRTYPRSVKLPNKPESAKRVNNEQEEMAAAAQGYESHWSPEINALQKGTAREILRDFTPVIVNKLPKVEVKEEEKEEVKSIEVFKEIKKLPKKR